MVWLLIVVLSGAVLIASLSVFLLIGSLTEEPNHELLIELQTRRAERRLHDLASKSFEAMLNEARSHSLGR